MSASTRMPALLLGAVLGLLALSGIAPQTDRLTWLLETFPVMIGAVVLLATWPRFPLTPLLCWLIAVHAVILIVGGYWSYSEVPLFDWLRDLFGWSRNHYDRVGHVAQGFVPAMIAREILIRRSPLRPGRWLFFLVTCVALAFSAFYELIEWWSSIAFGAGATAFLGTQGDSWDTQWDMLLALLGALGAQLLLAGVHDRQLAARGWVPHRYSNSVG
jgi:putative membrane protein